MQAVGAGGANSVILTREGSLWVTGSNGYGQLGDGSRIVKNTFANVAETSDGAWCTIPWMLRICGVKKPALASCFSQFLYAQRVVLMHSNSPTALLTLLARALHAQIFFGDSTQHPRSSTPSLSKVAIQW